jgi:putative phosphoribosyl transferase
MFEAISKKFQLRFRNRIAAGSVLAEILKERLKNEKIEHIVVLGIPRGGVVTADCVARKLSKSIKCVDFDIIIPRKITDRDNKEQAIGAVMEDGTTYIDEEIISILQLTPEYLEIEKAEQIQEIKRRKDLYAIDKSLNQYGHLENKIIILVDDGAATGATLIAACRWLKTKHTPKCLIIAVPVAPKATVKLLEHESDAVKAAICPSSTFRSVEQFYHDFEQVDDDRVIDILRTRIMSI